MTMNFFKIFFITDIHGSTACFRKFINSTQRERPPDILILGGDISGKFVVPMIEQAGGKYKIPVDDHLLDVEDDEVGAVEERLADSGCYAYKCDESAYKKYRFDPELKKSVARKLQETRLKEWLDFMDERLAARSTKVIINCGNDDAFYLDTILKSHSSVIFPEGQVVDLNDNLQLLSVGYSTPTPWKCRRELNEKKLKRRIADLLNKVRDPQTCIFNFHCPPRDTSLDLAPRLDKSLRPQLGLDGPEMTHVGSRAVRDAIKTFQPVLSLHGHVHEQHRIEKLGSTTCVNPGSSYWTGRLQGALVTFKGKNLAGVRLTSERASETAYATQRKLGFSILKKIPFIGDLVDVPIPHPHVREIMEKLSAVHRELDELRGRSSNRPKGKKEQDQDN